MIYIIFSIALVAGVSLQLGAQELRLVQSGDNYYIVDVLGNRMNAEKISTARNKVGIATGDVCAYADQGIVVCASGKIFKHVEKQETSAVSLSFLSTNYLGDGKKWVVLAPQPYAKLYRYFTHE